MKNEKFVVHTVNGKVVSRQRYFSHRGADQIIADRFERNGNFVRSNYGRIDPFVRNGKPIAWHDDENFAYQK